MSTLLDLSAAAGVLDAAGTPCTVAGTRVATWSDQGGAGAHVTQATAAARPWYVPAAYNNRPAVRFWPGAAMGRASVAWSQPFTYFLVYAAFGTRNQDEYFGGSSAGEFTLYTALTITDQYAGSSLSSTATVNPTLPRLISGVTNGAGSKWFDNGTLRASGSSGTGGIGTLRVGNGVFNAGFFGDVHALRVESGAMSDAARLAVETSLAAAWLTVAASGAAPDPSYSPVREVRQ